MQSSDGSASSTIKKISPFGIKNEIGPNCRLFYIMQNQSIYNNTTMTLTVLKNTGLFTYTKFIENWDEYTDVLNYFGDDNLCWLLSNEIIYFIKLEVGNMKTLAYKVDDDQVIWELVGNLLNCLMKLKNY